MALAHAPNCDINKGKLCSCGTEEMVQEFSSHLHTGLKLILDGDAAWPDLQNKTIHHVKTGIQIAGLEHGTVRGQPSVAIRLDLPDGSTVIAETSLRLFSQAARVLSTRFDLEV